MDRDILRRGDADTHLVALDAEHGDRDRVTDHQRLAHAAGQNQHANFSIDRHGCRCPAGLQPFPYTAEDTTCPPILACRREVMEPDPGRVQFILEAPHASTPSSAACSPGPSSPPPCARSGRPPPLPFTCDATCDSKSPAFTFFNALPPTPATSAALPAEVPASTITASPSCCFNRSIASRSALPSKPSSRAARTRTPATSRACPARSAVAP